MAANRVRIPLAKMAVEETGMGIVEDKIIKNHFAAEYIYNTYKDTKTCGVIEENAAGGMMKIAEPIGVIGAVIPTTNPTSTVIFKTLLALKTHNASVDGVTHTSREKGYKREKPVSISARHAGQSFCIVGGADAMAVILPQTDIEVMRFGTIKRSGMLSSRGSRFLRLLPRRRNLLI